MGRHREIEVPERHTRLTRQHGVYRGPQETLLQAQRGETFVWPNPPGSYLLEVVFLHGIFKIERSLFSATTVTCVHSLSKRLGPGEHRTLNGGCLQCLVFCGRGRGEGRGDPVFDDNLLRRFVALLLYYGWRYRWVIWYVPYRFGFLQWSSPR